MHQPPQSLSIRAISFPAVDLEAVGHDARAGLELLEFGLEPPRLSGNRKRAKTVACEMSASNMSPWTNFALVGDARGLRVLARDRDELRFVLDAERARARFAAAITLRPSPEPRSITKSLEVTLAMSSIFSVRV